VAPFPFPSGICEVKDSEIDRITVSPGTIRWGNSLLEDVRLIVFMGSSPCGPSYTFPERAHRQVSIIPIFIPFFCSSHMYLFSLV
jgi:hypothetical protein